MSARTAVLTGCIVVVAFDTVGSLASEVFNFAYEALSPVSFLIYGVTAVVAAQRAGKVRSGVLAGVAVAATEATLGWAISWLIGPGEPAANDQAAGTVLAVVLLVTLSGAAVGLLAGLLGRRLADRSVSSAQERR